MTFPSGSKRLCCTRVWLPEQLPGFFAEGEGESVECRELEVIASLFDKVERDPADAELQAEIDL